MSHGAGSPPPRCYREDSPCSHSAGCVSLPDDSHTHSADSHGSLEPLHSVRSEGATVLASGGPGAKREKRRYRRGKYRGVRERGPGRWVAEVKDSITGRRRWLGTFPTAEAAALAFDSAVRQIRGQTARTNFPEGARLSAASPAVVLSPEGARIQVPRGSTAVSASTSTGAAKQERWERGPSGSPLRLVFSQEASLIPTVGAGFSPLLSSRPVTSAAGLHAPGLAAATTLTSAHVTSSSANMTSSPALAHARSAGHASGSGLSGHSGAHSMEVDSSSTSLGAEGGPWGEDADELEEVDSFVLPAGDDSPLLSVEALEDLGSPMVHQDAHPWAEPRHSFPVDAQAQAQAKAEVLAESASPAPKRMSSAQCDNFLSLEGAMWQDTERGDAEGAPEALLPLALLRPSASISAKPSAGALVDSFDRAFGSLLAADMEGLTAPPASTAAEKASIPPFSETAYSSSPVVDLGSAAWRDVKPGTGLGAGQGLDAGASCNLSLDVIERLLMNN